MCPAVLVFIHANNSETVFVLQRVEFVLLVVFVTMQSVLVIVFVTMQSVPYDPTKQVQMQFTTNDFHRPPITQYFRSETKERIYKVNSSKKCISNLARWANLNISNPVHH